DGGKGGGEFCIHVCSSRLQPVEDATNPLKRVTTNWAGLAAILRGFFPSQHAENQLRQFRLSGGGGGDNSWNVGRLQGVGEAHVGHDGEADNLEAAVDGDQD